MSDSGDITSPPNGGHVSMPRRIPLRAVLAAALVVIGAAFGLGGWAWALQRTQEDHTKRLDVHDSRWRRVEAYMCLDCTASKQFDCGEICGFRRLEAR